MANGRRWAQGDGLILVGILSGCRNNDEVLIYWTSLFGVNSGALTGALILIFVGKEIVVELGFYIGFIQHPMKKILI